MTDYKSGLGSHWRLKSVKYYRLLYFFFDSEKVVSSLFAADRKEETSAV